MNAIQVMWYCLNKLFRSLSALFFIIVLNFFLIRFSPGDPFIHEQSPSETVVKQMHRLYQLDQPWYVQCVHYLKKVVTWDFGPSLYYETCTVNEIIQEGLPISMILGISAMIVALFLGILGGILSSIRPLCWQGRLSALVSIVGTSVPSFLVASFLQYVFAVKLSWVPLSGWGSFSSALLPILSLAFPPAAFIARMIRANMIEVLEQEYIQSAYAKGLSTIQVIFKHALKNSMLPVISYLGPLTTSTFTGSFLVERIFNIPGLGKWMIHSILHRDYPIMVGITCTYGLILIINLLLVDCLYSLIDPRIELKSMSSRSRKFR